MTRRCPAVPVRRLPWPLLAAVLLLSLVRPAQARDRDDDDEQPPGIEVALSQWQPPRPGDPEPTDHFKMQLELRPTRWDEVQVVADRRLLQLTVTVVPDDDDEQDARRRRRRRRSYRCRHPNAPRRVDRARVRTVTRDEPWRQWLDLRMYCWGAARGALLEHEAEIEVSYGFARRGRERWVVRPPAEANGETDEGQQERPAPLHMLEGEAVSLERAPSRTRDPDAPVRLEMASRSVARGGRLAFRVAVMAADGAAPQRVYVRPDLFRFRVDGPAGETECGIPRTRISPIVDFFRRVTRRRKVRETLDAQQYCPEGTFAQAGVYDVTPVVDLIYDASRYGLDAATGSYEGVPTPFRVWRGRRGYVDQDPHDWAAARGSHTDGSADVGSAPHAGR